MAKNKSKNLTYQSARDNIYNKDLSTVNFINTALDKTVNMFVYDGLPDTIPAKEFERLLQMAGGCIVTDVNGDLYALYGGFSGVNDAYDRPTQYTVANAYLNLSKTYTIGVDCVLCKNDYTMQGLRPTFEKYAVLIGDTEISMNMASILLRIPMLISAPDDKTKDSAELFLKRINDGEYGVIGETPFFDGIKTYSNTNNYSAYLTGYIELMQYFKASFCNDIGLNANFNMKRERLNESEIGLNIDALLPLIDEMYAQRVEAITAINDMYGTDIVVDYNSAWKTTHEEEEKETATQNTVVLNGVSEDSTNDIEPDTEPDTNDTEPDTNDTEPDTNDTEPDTNDSETEADMKTTVTNDADLIEDILDVIINDSGDTDDDNEREVSTNE